MRPGQPRQVVGLIGYPLRHSISPRFQQAGFDFLELPVRYEAWETPPADMAAAVDRARQSDCLGVNVTVPHKQTVIPLLDEVDDRASRIGAVNTIVNRDGRLTGYNTDADGFVRALHDVGTVLGGTRVALLGAGGVARAVACASAWAGALDLLILARRAEQAFALAADVVHELPERVRAASMGAAEQELADRDLIVNCTSVGMLHSAAEGLSPIPPAAIRSTALVYDLVYNPPTTRLLADARSRGARTLGGLPMLVYQGAAAFELWTGQKPPLGLMMARAEEALRGV